MTLTDEEIEAFVCGKCMYLAAALHRVHGWEIQAVVEPAEGGYPPFVGHAWCIDPATGHCVDIDGGYPATSNGWIRPSSNRLVTGLNEDSLRELTLTGASRHVTAAEWNLDVVSALAIVNNYLLPLLQNRSA